MIHYIKISNSNMPNDVYEKINHDLNLLISPITKCYCVSSREKKPKRIWQILSACSLMMRFSICVKKNDVILLRCPFEKMYILVARLIKKLKKARIAVIIEDANFIRYGQSKKSSEYIKACVEINKYDIILAQTQNFIDYMKEDVHCRFINYNVIPFCRNEMLAMKFNSMWHAKDLQIVFIGNLSKSRFLGKLSPQNYSLSLIGKCDEKLCRQFADKSNVKYLGDYDEAEKIHFYDENFHFGLIWDGDSLDITDDTSGLGEYLKYAAPYKFSNYITKGLPVIVWDESGMSDFVKNNGVGICIRNLEDLEKVSYKITFEEYEKMKKNVKNISKRIIKGVDLVEAVRKTLE